MHQGSTVDVLAGIELHRVEFDTQPGVVFPEVFGEFFIDNFLVPVQHFKMLRAVKGFVFLNGFIASDIQVAAMLPVFADVAAAHGACPGFALAVLLFKKPDEMLAYLIRHRVFIYFDKVIHSVSVPVSA